MKKIALGSALGSGIALMFSAPVFAQSSVTLYGVIDEGINYTNNVGGKSLVEMASGFIGNLLQYFAEWNFTGEYGASDVYRPVRNFFDDLCLRNCSL